MKRLDAKRKMKGVVNSNEASNKERRRKVLRWQFKKKRRERRKGAAGYFQSSDWEGGAGTGDGKKRTK